MKPYRLPRMYFLVLFLVILLMAGGGAWFYIEQRELLKENINDDLLTIAMGKVDQIVFWRHDQIAQGVELMETRYLVQSIAEWQTTGNSEIEQMILSQFRTIQKHYGYADIVLVDPEGQLLLSLMNNTSPLGGEVSKTLKASIAIEKPILTDLHTGAHDQNPHISVIAPLVSSIDGKTVQIGAIILVIDARDFLYPLIQSWPTQSKTAETLLVEKDGDTVIYLNELRHQKDTAFKLRFNLTETDIPAVNAVLGMEGIFTGIDYRGIEVLSALLPVPDSPWFMVAKIDTAEALAVWRTNSALIAAMLLGLLGIIAGGGVVFWQRDEKRHFYKIAESEAARRKSEASHRVTLMSVGDGVIVTDKDGFVQLINPVAEALTGWNLAEAQGKPLEQVFRIINEETQEKVENPAIKVIREGLVVGLANHTLLESLDGSKRPIADSGAPIRDDNGEISGVVLVFRDQTEERESQRELIESEKKFHTYFDSTPTAITLSSTEGKYLMVNPAFCDLVGYSQEEVLKKGVADFTHPDDLRAFNTRVRTMLSGVKIAYKVEKRIVTKEGSVIWVEGNTNLIRDDAGKPLFFLSNMNNITERKQAEEKIKTSETRYRKLFESAKDGILILDYDSGQVVDVNPILYELLSLKSVEILGKELWKIGLFKDIAASREAYIKLTKEKYIRYKDLPLRNNKGKEIYVEFVTNVYEVNSHKVLQCNIRDITIRKKAEDQVRKLNEELEQRVEERTKQLKIIQEKLIRQERLAVLGQLAGGVSHELRNPLGVISNAVYFLGMVLPNTDPKTREYISIIDSETHRAEKIITDLLDFSRIRSAEKESFNLFDLVMKTHNLSKKPDNVNVETKFPDKMPAVYADPMQVQLIIRNLLENAYQAMPEGGIVTLSGKEKIIKKKPYVVLEVQDTGIGITPENLKKLFEPLFSTKQRGIGLGLATSKNLVQSNGGMMEASSEPGKGSLFTVYLPAEKPDRD